MTLLPTAVKLGPVWGGGGKFCNSTYIIHTFYSSSLKKPTLYIISFLSLNVERHFFVILGHQIFKYGPVLAPHFRRVLHPVINSDVPVKFVTKCRGGGAGRPIVLWCFLLLLSFCVVTCLHKINTVYASNTKADPCSFYYIYKQYHNYHVASTLDASFFFYPFYLYSSLYIIVFYSIIAINAIVM